MSSLYSILLFFLITGLVYYAYLKQTWEQFTLYHLYLIAVFISYGVITLIYQVSNLTAEHNLLFTMTAHTLVFVEVLVFLALLKLFPTRNSNWMSLNRVMERLEDVSDGTVLFLMSAAVSMVLVLFYKYGTLSYFNFFSDPIEKEPIPYFISSLTMHLVDLLAGIFVVIAVKVIAKKDKATLLSWPILLAWAGLLFLYGRRNLFYPAFISLVYFLRFKNINLFGKKSVPVLVLVGLLMLMSSNLYQKVRVYLPAKLKMSENFNDNVDVSDVFNFESSYENVQTRTPNYLVDQRLLESMKGSIWGAAELGETTKAELQNAVPSVLWPEKTMVFSDEIINRSTGQENTDIPTTIFNLFLADYGYFALILVPICLFLYWTIFAYILSKLAGNSLFFVAGFSTFFQNAFHVEGGLTGIFVSVRDATILIGLLKVFEILSHAWRMAVSKSSIA